MAKNQECVLGILGFEKCRPFFLEFSMDDLFFCGFFQSALFGGFLYFFGNEKKNAGAIPAWRGSFALRCQHPTHCESEKKLSESEVIFLGLACLNFYML